MRVRPLLVLTALVSSILGAVVVYLVLSVPNDLRADALLKQARQDLKAGESEKARQSLSTIVQQYPRTDAAAAATVALVSLGQKERDDLARAIALLRRQNEQQTAVLTSLQQDLAQLRKPAEQPVTVTAPPAKTPAKTTPAKKTPAKKKTSSKRSTRRRR